MNILLDAGIAIVGLAAVAFAGRFAARRGVETAFIQALAAKNEADYDRAVALFDKASQIARVVDKQAPVSSDAKIMIAWCNIEQGRFSKALNILSSQPGGFKGLSPLVPTAWIFLQTGDLKNAELMVDECMKRFGRGTMVYASASCVAGWLRIKQDRFDEAHWHLRESLQECQRIAGSTSKFCVPPAMNLAWLELLRSNFIEATRLVSFAVQTYTAKFGARHPRTAQALVLRGVIGLVLEEYDLARRDLYQARRVLKMHDLMEKPSGQCLLLALNWLAQK